MKLRKKSAPNFLMKRQKFAFDYTKSSLFDSDVCVCMQLFQEFDSQHKMNKILTKRAL